MEKRRRTAGTVILQIALGLMFVVSGIWILMGYDNHEVINAINYIFSGDVEIVLKYVFAVIELIAGLFLILRIFINLNTKLDSVLMVIIMICWIVAIIMIDFISRSGLFHSFNSSFLSFLSRFANHLLVLGAIIKVKD